MKIVRTEKIFKLKKNSDVLYQILFAFMLIRIMVIFSISLKAQNLTISTDTITINSGKKIFKKNCAECHGIFVDRGCPKLSGINERHEIGWLIKFIKSPKLVIESGDKHANALYRKYKYYMPNHNYLSDIEIMSILSYIKNGTNIGPANHIEEESDNITFIITVVILVLILILIFLIVQVRKYI